MLNGVLLKKLASLEQILTELQSLGLISAADLQTDWKTRRAIERSLQLAIEIIIDSCQRILSVRGETPAATAGDAVDRCIALGAFADRPAYRQMVRFRNLIVHKYDIVESAVLAEIVNERLSDLADWRREVLDYVANRS